MRRDYGSMDPRTSNTLFTGNRRYALALADLQWLQMMEHDVPSPIDLTDLTALFNLWQSGSAEWQKRVKCAFRRFQRQEHMMQQMHRLDIFLTILQCCSTFQGGLQCDVDQMCVEHTCFCGRSFTTAQGLAAHKRQKHQIGAMERHLIDGPTCPSCLKFFWSRQRLYQHLSYIPRRSRINHCFQDLQKRGFKVLKRLRRLLVRNQEDSTERKRYKP